VETGDLGHSDTDGHYSINGRKKNLIISSFGRNISPEWIESECLQNGFLNQCVVFGDAKPWPVTLVSPTNPQTSNGDIDNWMNQVNKNLPDYAQIKNWLRIPSKLSYEDGLLTENGRPKRASIEQYYANDLQQLFIAPHYSFSNISH
jgi:long-subunit acyl-CoA synthetase (AMP-forming)